MRRLLLMFLTFCCLAVALPAERVFLDNGRILIGDIVEETPEAIVISTDVGNVRVLRDRIERIDDKDGPRTHALLVQYPVATILSAVLGQYGALIEYQQALRPAFAVHANAMYMDDGWMRWMSLMAGPQFRPGGRYLAGFYTGAELGVEYRELQSWWYDSVTSLLLGRVDLQLGYEWVRPRGFTVAFWGGAMFYFPDFSLWDLMIAPDIAFSVGWAF